MDRDIKQDNDRQQELITVLGQPATSNGSSAASDAGLTFEESLQRLEQIVSRLEAADISLDESLRLFQEGTRLSHICSGLLESIEGRITQLVESQDGKLLEVPFSGESE